MSIHNGHRERLKKRFRQEGLDHFDELYVLELLLFYCVPRQDTNALAHRLLSHFGSLVNVLDASAVELQKVEGVGEGIITFFSLRTQLERYYQIKRAQMEETQLADMDAIGKYLMGFFRNRRNEMVYLLCLDAKCKVLACYLIAEGSVNSANISTRKIVEKALASNASSVVIAHNHPSGLALPSSDDVGTTHIIANALKAIDVSLVDHLVYTEEDYVSLVQSGYYRP